MVTQVTDLTLCDRMCSALIVQVVWLLPQSLPPRADYFFCCWHFCLKGHYIISFLDIYTFSFPFLLFCFIDFINKLIK